MVSEQRHFWSVPRVERCIPSRIRREKPSRSGVVCFIGQRNPKNLTSYLRKVAP